MRRKRWFVMVALAAALMAELPADQAAARKPKETVSAVINGHRFKLKRAQLATGRTPEGGFSVGGGTRPHRLHQVIKGIALGCAIGLASDVFPVPGQFCAVGYSEIVFASSLPTKQWVGISDAVEVTLDSFDGTRLKGTFQGTLAPADPNAGYGPATIQNGRFSIVFE
jgi:hypothetical protein